MATAVSVPKTEMENRQGKKKNEKSERKIEKGASGKRQRGEFEKILERRKRVEN